MKNTRDNTEELCGACRNGNIEVVEEILSNKEVNINGRDCVCVGDTPLICPVRSGHLHIVRRILQHSEVEVNASDYAGYTPLMDAVNYGYLDIVRTLLEVPALQLGKGDEYGSALHQACMHNRVSIMKLLCQDSRCSPGVVNKKNSYDGVTALMMAVCFGLLDIVKELDREGTDFFTKDRDGTTLIEMARGMNRAKVLEYLIKRNKVDSLKVIAGHNVVRYVKNKSDVEALEIPGTVRQFLAGFVDDYEYHHTDDDDTDDDDADDTDND